MRGFESIKAIWVNKAKNEPLNDVELKFISEVPERK